MLKKVLHYLMASLTVGQKYVTNGTARFFAFWLIIEGTTEKVLQFKMQVKSIYNKNFHFVEQKMYFLTLQRGSSKKKSINWHYFCDEKNFLLTFSELPPIDLSKYYTKMCCSIRYKLDKLELNFQL